MKESEKENLQKKIGVFCCSQYLKETVNMKETVNSKYEKNKIKLLVPWKTQSSTVLLETSSFAKCVVNIECKAPFAAGTGKRALRSARRALSGDLLQRVARVTDVYIIKNCLELVGKVNKKDHKR